MEADRSAMDSELDKRIAVFLEEVPKTIVEWIEAEARRSLMASPKVAEEMSRDNRLTNLKKAVNELKAGTASHVTQTYGDPQYWPHRGVRPRKASGIPQEHMLNREDFFQRTVRESVSRLGALLAKATVMTLSSGDWQEAKGGEWIYTGPLPELASDLAKKMPLIDFALQQRATKDQEIRRFRTEVERAQATELWEKA